MSFYVATLQNGAARGSCAPVALAFYNNRLCFYQEKVKSATAFFFSLKLRGVAALFGCLEAGSS
jgi:hypothetical protein